MQRKRTKVTKQAGELLESFSDDEQTIIAVLDQPHLGRNLKNTSTEVEAAIPILCPHYHNAVTMLREVVAWAKQCIPGAN
jgi:hypothetical protein